MEKSKAYAETLPSEEEFLEFQKRYPPRTQYVSLKNEETIAGHDISKDNIVECDDYELVSYKIQTYYIFL